MSVKKCVFWLHLTTGIFISILIATLSITGALLAFRPQLVSMTATTVQAADLSAVITKALSQYPNEKINRIVVASTPIPKAVATVGESKTAHFLKEVEAFHRWFGFTGTLKPVVAQVKAVVNLLFLVMIISGLYLWWPRKTMRFSASVSQKTNNWRWHNVVGFWASPILLAITITGMILSAEAPSKPTQRKRVPTTLVMIEKQGGGFESFRGQLDSDGGITLKPIPRRPVHTWAKTIHTGEAGGVVGQILALFGSVAALVLIWTGLAMSWKRFFKKES